MANFDNLAPQSIGKLSTCVLVEVPVPHPVIIYNQMRIQDWKSCFIQKKDEAVSDTDKLLYTQCLKTLMLAELCNCVFCVVTNSKGNRGLAVNFYLEFLYPDFLEVFLKSLESISVLSKVV